MEIIYSFTTINWKEEKREVHSGELIAQRVIPKIMKTIALLKSFEQLNRQILNQLHSITGKTNNGE